VHGVRLGTARRDHNVQNSTDQIDYVSRQLAAARESSKSPFSIRLSPDEPNEVRWGYTVRWWNGQSCTSSGYKTKEEAKAAAFAFAKELGWTPRRWWQFWRWGEKTP
jgi:hypothetical protein